MLDGKESTLISEAFVYRLVWAIKAVRVQGAAADGPSRGVTVLGEEAESGSAGA